MKKKSKTNIDVGQAMVQIQEQLAALDKKLESFITKSLTELAQALAAQKTAAAPRPGPVSQQAVAMARSPEAPRRPMFAVICFECGKDTEIPFKPSPGRPVYCKECFAKRKAGHNKPQVKAEAPTPPAPAVHTAPVETIIKENKPKSAVKPKKKAPAPKGKKSAAKKKPAVKKKR